VTGDRACGTVRGTGQPGTGTEPAQVSRDRVRAFRRAARAWNAGYPHAAWEILTRAGYESDWPEFLRTALIMARREFHARLI
jgi:hypothetical protein